MTDQTIKILNILAHANGLKIDDWIELDYEGRFFRYKKLQTANGQNITVELEHAYRFSHGEVLQSDDNLLFEIRAKAEELLEVKGDLTRYAWHIGNRHQPCQIEADRLLVQSEATMKDMLEGLGARINSMTEPFNPEGGAYTHGHSHAHDH